MTDAVQNTPQGFKDRSTLLLVFGVLEILLGALAGGMGLLMIFMQFFARTMMPEAPQNSLGMAMGSIVYAVAAAAFIWLGIGSIKARRWARALMLTLSSMALVFGVMAFAMMLFVMPKMLNFTPPGGPEVPEGFMIGMMVFMMMFLFCIYILLPSVLVLVYRGKHVKATCEWRDPKVRWTDKCPLPVLAVSILCAWGAVGLLVCAFMMPILPLPNGVLTGIPAGVVMVVMGVILAYLARGTYELNQTAWWVLLGLVTSCSLYGVFLIGTGRIDWLAYYEAAGIPAEQIAMIQTTGMLTLMDSPVMKVFMALWVCLYVGYVLYVRRFFVNAGPQAAAIR